LLSFERVREGANDPPAGFVGIGLDSGEDKSSVVIDSVVDDSPAKKAGLRPGDVLLKVGETEILDGMTLLNLIRFAAQNPARS
jgi:carboxyl-terminal processing protease